MIFALLLLGLSLAGLVKVAGATPPPNTRPDEAARWWDYAPDFQAISFSSDGKAWAVGTGGTIYRYDGSAWKNYPSPTTEQLSSVTTISDNEAWAAGSSGTILHLSGGVWMTATSGLAGGYLTSIRFASPNNGWAMGYSGLCSHWDGTAWAACNLTNQNIYAIDFLNANDGWAVGDTTLHWNGSTWTANTDTNGYRLFGVDMAASNDAWAGTLDGNLWHWNGTSWTQTVVNAPAEFNTVRMLSSNDGWAVGGHHFSTTTNSFIYHWNGTNWTAVSEPSARALLGLDCPNSANCTAVGDHGTILNLSGGTWAAYRNLPDIANFAAVSAADAQNAVAVGTFNDENGFYEGSAYQWSNGNWQRTLVRGPGYKLLSVKMVSDTEAWAGGSDGVFMHWSSGTWTPLTTTLIWEISGLDMLGNDGWAVGKNGSIWRYDGSTWAATNYTPTNGLSINAVSMVAPNDVWAVGNDGQAIHWNGSTWTASTIGGGQILRAVKMVSSTDGWAVGDAGTILRFDGTNWNSYTSPIKSTLYSLDMVDATEGWAGGNGFFLHYQNGLWTQVTAPNIGQLNSIDMLSSSKGFGAGAGNFGELLLYGSTQCPEACATPTPAVTATPTDCADPFTDLNGNIFRPAIRYLYCRGVVNGTGQNTFGPAGTSTRAQFAKVVVLGFGIASYTPATPSFTDVPSSYYAYAFIEAGYQVGILSGYDAQTCLAIGAAFPCYGPNRPITRAQLTKLVVNAAGYTPYTPATQTFIDVQPNNIFYVSIETAHNKGVINGYADNTFRPNLSIRRDEMCQIVYKGVTTP